MQKKLSSILSMNFAEVLLNKLGYILKIESKMYIINNSNIYVRVYNYLIQIEG